MSMSLKFFRKSGRVIRDCDLGILRTIESFLVRNDMGEVKMPLLGVCGPPRSGHTLTHQILSQGLNVFTLSNLQCIFFRSPFVGYLLSKLFCRPYISDYKSTGGYVSGLNGPHEGTLVWNYWCDLNYVERPPQPDPARIRKFLRLMNRLYALDRRPFCDSSMTHAFYFQQFKENFPRHIVIRTRRDLLSNALSILNYTQKRHDIYGSSLMSLVPKECQNPSVMSGLSPFERVARQVYFINRRMDEQTATGRFAVFESEFSELCENPSDFISRFMAFGATQGIKLEPRSVAEFPKKFIATKVYRNQNDQTKKLAQAFDDLVEQYGPISQPVES